MNEQTELLLGWVGSLVVALVLVAATAMALQAWHPAHHRRAPATALEQAPPVAPLPVAPSHVAPSDDDASAPSSYWSGRS